ncbi:MAG: hypothetical protein DMD94_20070 [Candidatus Rokuibacteriota bacterium]|nr:MAG: hypothetical protein DMD94_20070 [Candidatus Rokubacteria bacterium]
MTPISRPASRAPAPRRDGGALRVGAIGDRHRTAPGTAGSIIPAGARAAAASLPSAPRPAAHGSSARRPSVGPYRVQAGTIVPAVLRTGVNSNLPGQLIDQVPGPIFDTETGQRLRVQRAREPRPGVAATARRHGVPMKLKQVQTYPAALLKERVPPRLKVHTTHNRDPTDQAIDLWPWAVQILEQFPRRGSGVPGVAAEDAERAWLRTQNEPGGGCRTKPAEDAERALGRTQNKPGAGPAKG